MAGPGVKPQQAPAAGKSGPDANRYVDLGNFTGPRRWPLSAAYAQTVASLTVFIQGQLGTPDQSHGGDPARLLQQLTLTESRPTTVTFGKFGQPQVQVKALRCEYERTSAATVGAAGNRGIFDRISFTLWAAGQRKALAPGMVNPELSGWEPHADLEATACPAQFSEALFLAFGDEAWPSVTEAVRRRDKQFQERVATGQLFKKDYSLWAQNPKAQTPARDRELASEISAVVTGLETQGQQLRWREYERALNQKIEPLMAELAASGVAQAQKIGPGEAGRKAFESWDNGIGQTVVSLCARLNAFRARGGQASNLLIGVLGRFQQLYGEQIADKGALDKAYMDRMLASIAQYRVTIAGVDEPTHSSLRNEQVWVMRPKQSLMYRKINQGIELLQSYAQARAEIEEQARTLDRELKATRTAFWACYATRCANGGALFHKFSVLVNARDAFLIQKTMYEGAFNRMGGPGQDGRFGAVFSKLMGMDREIDTNYGGACDPQYDRFLSPFLNVLVGNPLQARQKIEAAMNGPEQQRLQQCRDQMEFILRPRGATSGLL